MSVNADNYDLQNVEC